MALARTWPQMSGDTASPGDTRGTWLSGDTAGTSTCMTVSLWATASPGDTRRSRLSRDTDTGMYVSSPGPGQRGTQGSVPPHQVPAAPGAGPPVPTPVPTPMPPVGSVTGCAATPGGSGRHGGTPPRPPRIPSATRGVPRGCGPDPRGPRLLREAARGGVGGARGGRCRRPRSPN